MSSNELLAAALSYAQRGWTVLPVHTPTGDGGCSCGNPNCDSPGKHPRIKAWQKKATTDETVIRRWWKQWPTANVGINPRTSDLIVIDIDPRNGGDETWRELKLHHGINDDTVTSLTGGGGTHLLYSINGVDPQTLKVSLGPGVDVQRGDKQIIVEPSLHQSGHCYEWEISGHPNDMPPLPLPPSLLHILKKDNNAGKKKTAPAVNGKIPSGERDNTLTSLAGSMRRRGMTEIEILAALREVNKRCDPPKMEDDLTRIAQSVAQYEPEIQPTDNTILLKYGYEDEGNARTMMALHGDKFCFCEAYGWLHWNGQYWKRDDAEAALDIVILATLKQRRVAAVKAEKEAIVATAKPSAHRLRGTKTILKSLLITNVDEFDKSPDHLNCQNGILDLRTGEVTPHSPDQQFTYCLPISYSPSASQKVWKEWLLEAVGDEPAIARYIQAAIGYSLTGHTWEECLFYIYGPTRGGKGTFVEAILTMLGRKPLATEADFKMFAGTSDSDSQNFDLAPLKPCRFVAASESDRNQRLKTERIKSITGGNDIRCAFKYKTHFSYRPQFKVWLSSNYPVNGDPEDDALWSRVRVINFPNSYLGREDKRLKWKMKRPETLAGILAWAVEGSVQWYEMAGKGLETPEVVTKNTTQARTDIDFVGQWMEECIEITKNGNGFMTNAAIYISYETWAKSNGVTPKKQRALTIALKRRGLNAGKSKKIEEKTHRGCYGIGLLRTAVAPIDV